MKRKLKNHASLVHRWTQKERKKMRCLCKHVKAIVISKDKENKDQEV